MKPFLLLIFMLAISFGSFVVGTFLGDRINAIRIARRAGWTREHSKIYEELISVTTVLSMKEERELLTSEFLKTIMLPSEERAKIRELLVRYEKEKGIA